MPKRDGSDVTCRRMPADRGKGKVVRAVWGCTGAPILCISRLAAPQTSCRRRRRRSHAPQGFRRAAPSAPPDRMAGRTARGLESAGEWDVKNLGISVGAGELVFYLAPVLPLLHRL